jgi:BirA family transcriptional regulator, biotin operon repressor / biotin---[acetyl-CoA-carboxylase] ligase
MGEILRFAELDSTNDEVSRRVRDGAPDGLWVMADRQSKGRGRRGRAWQSAANGNLYCSGLVRVVPGEPPVQQLSFVAALAVHEVLAPLVPGLKLKWPNDLMADGRKLTGILLESGGTGSGGLWLVVGIGINLAAHPADSERPATDVLALTGVRHDPEIMLKALAQAFAQWRLHWRQGGFAVIKAAWLAASQGLGERLVARLGHETIEGVFAGLGDDGALQLLLESGDMRVIHAGEVFGI